MSQSITGMCECDNPRVVQLESACFPLCLNCGRRCENPSAHKQDGAILPGERTRVLRAKFDRFKRDTLARFKEIEEEFDRMN